MNTILDRGPHEITPVATMRCLAIVECLGRSTAANSALTLQKAAIFDGALKNPNIAKRLFSTLAPDKISLAEIPDVLYPDEIDYGFATSTRDITKIAALLRLEGLISIELDGEVLALKPKNQQALINIATLPNYWKSILKASKSLLPKSAHTLQQAVIRESKNHAERHIFIARTVSPQGSNEELRSNVY